MRYRILIVVRLYLLTYLLTLKVIVTSELTRCVGAVGVAGCFAS